MHAGEAKEIGWHPVTLRDAAREDALFAGVPSSFTALHWRGDVFELPAGATALARAVMTEHQAFRWGKSAWGLLFHVEADAKQVRAMSEAFADELTQAKVDASDIDRGSALHGEASGAIAHTLFGRWSRARGVEARAQPTRSGSRRVVTMARKSSPSRLPLPAA